MSGAENAGERSFQSTPGSGLLSGFFYLVYFLSVWLVFDPRLVRHSLGIYTPYPPFAFDTRWSLLWEHLTRVGGCVEYAVRGLTAFYAIGWVGALIITGAAWLTGISAVRLARRAGWRRGDVLAYGAAAMVLLLHAGYHHPLRLLLSLLAGLGVFAIYASYGPRSPARRGLLFLLLDVAFYLVAGSGSLLFPVLVAVDELCVRRQRAIAAVAIAWGLAVPWAVGSLLGLDMKEAYAGFLLADPGVASGWPLALALSLYFPAALGGVAFLADLRARKAARAQVGTERTKASGSAKAASASGARRRAPIVTMAACSFGIAALAWFLSNSFVHTILEMDFLSEHERWNEVLRIAEHVPSESYNVRCARNVLLALYHSGRLGDEMCHYGLRMDPDLFYTPKRHEDLGSHCQESRLLLELGQVNEAGRCGYEALELSGPHPAVLQELATINLVKGQVETAKVFLRALAFQPFRGRVARQWLRSLDEAPDMKGLPRIQQLRANMIHRDRVFRYNDLEEYLQSLLAENSHNRMAFEFLMANYLEKRRPDRVAASLARLKELGYTRVPRHYQEAWVIATGRPESPPPIPGFELDPQVVQQGQQFHRVMEEAGDTPDGAVMAWNAGLGDSYYFFVTYGFSYR